MLETLISSKTRIKLLLKFFLNSKATAYLRGLEAEFGDSTNAIRVELNRFEKAGMLTSFLNGNRKYFQANTNHPLYRDTHNLVMKYIGLDRIVDSVIENLGHIKKVYVTGDFARGIDSSIIDLVFVGDINKNYLIKLIEKVEQHLRRKIRYIVCSEEEMNTMDWTTVLEEALLLWES
jgi:hypothetical protein